MKKNWIYISFLILLASCKPSIKDGYTDQISYESKDSISIFLNSEKDIKDFKLEITDINGSLVSSVSTDIFPQTVQSNKPYENGFGYEETVKIATPQLESGVYLLDNEIPFIVKPSKPYDILILYSSNTENAYSNSGGKSTYAYNSSDKVSAPIVSFHRPINLPFHSSEFLKWIADQDQYNIGYICDQDMDDYYNIASAKLLIIPGHSEYWTREARNNFDRFINEGNNALILSGNTMWWQVRYEQENNQMICYKKLAKDPVEDEKLKTITWPDSLLDYSVMNSIGLDFEHGGFGKQEDQGWDGYKIVNPSSPLLHGSELQMNDIIHLPSDEYDGAALQFSLDSSSVTIENDLNFHRYELIGYDLASRKAGSNGAWIAMQKTDSSGVIINTGSTDWCRKAGMEEEDSDVIKKITINMIDLLLHKKNVFTTN